jgi:hypothetical protein
MGLNEGLRPNWRGDGIDCAFANNIFARGDYRFDSYSATVVATLTLTDA